MLLQFQHCVGQVVLISLPFPETGSELLLELSKHYFATSNPMRDMNGHGCAFLNGSSPKEYLQKTSESFVGQA